MKWKEFETQTRKQLDVGAEKSKELDEAKASHLPEIQKEAEAGFKPFKPVDFQPVRSPDRYEAEFGVKGDDLVFHFWPWGYHTSERHGENPPPFVSSMVAIVTKALAEVFDLARVTVLEDKDVGAIYAKAQGYGINQFHRELAIRACEVLHQKMGGK